MFVIDNSIGLYKDIVIAGHPRFLIIKDENEIDRGVRIPGIRYLRQIQSGKM